LIVEGLASGWISAAEDRNTTDHPRRKLAFPNSELLHHRRLKEGPSTLLYPLRFYGPLLVCGPLARSNLVEGVPFRFHPHVGVTGEHGTRHVPRNAHDYLVARAGLRKRRYFQDPL
jgi:hypothetical protein